MTDFYFSKAKRNENLSWNARNQTQENPREKSVTCIFLFLRPLYVNQFFVAAIQFSFLLRVGELYIQLDLLLLYYHM